MMARNRPKGSPKGPDSPVETSPAERRAEATLATPVGPITVVCSPDAVIGVQWRSPSVEDILPLGPSGDDGLPTGLLTETIDQMRAYFAGRLREFDLPLSLDGVSAVGRSVLTTLRDTVGYGTVVTYGELAQSNGRGVPARAIGGIMGSNPLPLLIPCHRVVASTGLGGYSGGERGRGLETKRWLLEFEGSLQRGLF